ncbi:MAG: deoxyribonuclease IV [Gemmatimonadaceae bacterium]|nr:deoxyribonuclease IV [Gemmatimonadaceae bacterium]
MSRKGARSAGGSARTKRKTSSASSAGATRSKASAPAAAPSTSPSKSRKTRTSTARAAAGRSAAGATSSPADAAQPLPPTPDDLLGAHVSSAGGTHEAPGRARAIAASAMQIFSKMANRWAERECLDEECQRFRDALGGTTVRATIAHDSYLINLASPDEVLRARSIESFIAELRRCEALGLHYLVSHPGNFMDDRDAGIARNADAISESLLRVPGDVVLCMETTVGAGTSIGGTFEELAALIARVDPRVRARVGVCVDTCHVYSAGYDLVGDYEGVWARFEDVLGRELLKVMHLNDSKTPFASHRDRHELIAEGSLGAIPFQRIMNDERLATIPKVIETPKLDDAETTDRRMLERLRGYLAAGADRRASPAGPDRTTSTAPHA